MKLLNLVGTIEGFVPSFNNRSTIAKAITSLQRQTVPLARILVVDDGSDDDSATIIRQQQAEFLELEHSGRGMVRATGITACQSDFQLCCDATMEMEPRFLEKALPFLTDRTVGAVFGGIRSKPSRNPIDRWRARHLFKEGISQNISKKASLATYGCVLRRSAVLQVGNFDPHLSACEDRELGFKLLHAGFDVIFLPDTWVTPLVRNTLAQVFERYFRWNSNPNECMRFRDYMKLVWYSFKVLVPQDLKARDWVGGCISLLLPHYQFYRASLKERT